MGMLAPGPVRSKAIVGRAAPHRCDLHRCSETCTSRYCRCVREEVETEGRGDMELGSYWTVALGAEVLHAYTICRGKGWWRR